MKPFILLLSILYLANFSFAQQTPESPVHQTWSLEDCIQYALANSISIKGAEINTSLAEVNYSQSLSARTPNLFFNASQILSSGNTVDPITSEYITDQIHSGNVGINSSITLFQGNQINNQIRQDRLLLEQSSLQEEVEKNNIVLVLLETYLQALYSKESISIAENNLAALEKEVERAKARLDAETIALSDYTEAISQAATNKYNLIAAKNGYQQYIIQLKQLLELPPETVLSIEPIDEEINDLYLNSNSHEIYTTALAFLPELKVSHLNIAANERQLAIAKGGYMPTLALTGTLGSGYTSFNNSTVWDQFDINLNQRLALSLNIPILNRKQTKSAVQTAALNIDLAQLQKQTLEKEIYSKIETAYQNALSTHEQLLAALASQIAAEESYKLAQKRYELGDLSTTDLVISQNTYTNTQQNYLQAKYLNILYNQLLQYYQGNAIKL